MNVTFTNILELILSLIIYCLQQFDNKYLDNQTELKLLLSIFLRIKIYSLQKIALSKNNLKNYVESNFHISL